MGRSVPQAKVRNVLEGECAWNGTPGFEDHPPLKNLGNGWAKCPKTGCWQRVKSKDGELVLEIAYSSIGGTFDRPIEYARERLENI